MEERGPEGLLNLAYGNHPKSAKLKNEGARILRALREGAKTLEELAQTLSIDLTQPAARKHFYLVMRPLREKGMVGVSRVGGKRLYHVSLDGFNIFWKSIRREAEYWLKEKVEEEG
ncbi:MAG: helix-turn-helix domain-containing protein [Candidatus Hadarchaeales archaeon]